MGIKSVREGNACDRCKKLDTEVGKITNYTKYDENLLLCANCIKKVDREKTLKCPRCKKVVGSVGITEYINKSMCYECMNIVKKKDVERKKLSQFFKNNWQFWIYVGLGVIAVILAYLALK